MLETKPPELTEDLETIARRGPPGRAGVVFDRHRYRVRIVVRLLLPGLSTAGVYAVSVLAAETASDTSVAAKIESRWAMFAFGIIFLLLAIIIFTTLHWSTMPTSRVEVIDATTLHCSGEFVEENLGTSIDARGNVTVHLLAEQYAFRPHCIVVPAGALYL